MGVKIGIPRALLFYKYFPMWKTFFENLGLQVVVSPETKRRILNAGLKVAENELCLPVKAYFGHVLKLQTEVDYIFNPRIVSVQEDGYTCPKLLGLPDMIANLIQESNKAQILDAIVNMKEKKDWELFFQSLGKQLDFSKEDVKKAKNLALKAQRNFHFLLHEGFLPNEIFEGKMKKEKLNGDDLVIGIAGHSYLLYDSYLNMDLIEKVRKMGSYILTPEMISTKKIKRAVSSLPKPLFWNYQREIFGAVYNWCQDQKIDGIIHLPAFPCGPDSVMGTFIKSQAKQKNIPLMPITIDEHSAEAGVQTRIEAFIDMIRRRKKATFKSKKWFPGEVTKLKSIKIPRGERIVSFPRMGRDTHLALKYFFNQLGVKCLIPPSTSERTLELGVKYAPETICLPLKINLGNYIQALEAGANVLIHAGGCGPCRFGFYGSLAEVILKEELEYDFQFKIIEPAGAQGLQTFADFFRFFSPGIISRYSLPVTKKIVQGIHQATGWPWVELCPLLGVTPHDLTLWKIIKAAFFKKQYFDLIDKKVLKTRCYEVNRGDIDRVHQKAIKMIDQAQTLSEIEEAKEEALGLVENVDQDRSRNVLKVGLVGELYILLDPFINFDIEKWLGRRGIYIEKGIYTSDFIAPTKENIVGGVHYNTLIEKAKPYLNYKVGGEGLPTIGHTVLSAQHGFDGVVHMMPFTCMPETVAKQILPSVSGKENIPVLSLVIDEQTGKAGVETRLEAFIDLMRNRRELVKGGWS